MPIWMHCDIHDKLNRLDDILNKTHSLCGVNDKVVDTLDEFCFRKQGD